MASQSEIEFSGVTYIVSRKGQVLLLVRQGIEAGLTERVFGECAASTGENADRTLSVQRGAVLFTVMGRERVVIRQFLRGGLLGRLQQRYFHAFRPYGWRSSRPARELEILSHLRQQQIPVVEPLAARIVFSGAGCCYQGSIMTKEVEGASNLHSLLVTQSLSDTEAQQIARKTGTVAAAMLAAGVFHCDLHPGNVLVALNREHVTLLDFDKAVFFKAGRVKEYRVRLERRWERACRKRCYAISLAEEFASGLRAGGLIAPESPGIALNGV